MRGDVMVRRAQLDGKWSTVGLLWFCGFFNYADRQAITAVFPLLAAEFALSKTQLGILVSAFMVVYALAAPLAGSLVDRFSRRILVIIGLAFWSLIAAATGTARSFGQLYWYRAAEGLGESCYFPASMSLLADKHGRETRSRAMSVHQTSVYVGTMGGGVIAGLLAERYGWRFPFYILGGIGFAYAMFLAWALAEPVRGAADGKPSDPGQTGSFLDVFRRPVAVCLLAAFAGANFVAMALTSWLPMYVYTRFDQGVALSAIIGTTYMPIASLVGALLGGVLADRLAAGRPGGRMAVQAMALLLGTPCIWLVGTASSVSMLMVAMTAIGFCKGIYDANIFASMYDVVPAEIRGKAAGLLNTIGWAGASLAAPLIGWLADRSGSGGLGPALASTSAVYLLAAGAAASAALLARRLPLKPPSSSPDEF